MDFDNDGDTDIVDFIILDWLVSGIVDILAFAFQNLFTGILTVLMIASGLLIWYMTT